MRYALCFFPLIGLLIGALSMLLYAVCSRTGVSPLLYAAIAMLLPLLVSGGIHMDGFMDTADAISSHASQEKKLEILKDSNIGAFGVLYCVAQMLLSFALWSQLYLKPAYLILVGTGYVLSRCLSALSVATFPTARTSGLVYVFADHAAKVPVILSSLLVLGLSVWKGIAACGLWGLGMFGVVALYFLLHRRFCIRTFGGNTGDLAGFMLQNIEMLILLIAVIAGLLF